MIIKKGTSKASLIRAADCKQCGNCCMHSSGIVLPSEIARIAKYLGMKDKAFAGKYLVGTEMFHTDVYKFKQEKNNLPSGSCIFSTGGKCKIHLVKPLFCKITTCSSHGDDAIVWFYLNFLVNPDDPQSVRDWALYLTAGKNIPGGKLKELVPDESKLKKILDYKI